MNRDFNINRSSPPVSGRIMVRFNWCINLFSAGMDHPPTRPLLDLWCPKARVPLIVCAGCIHSSVVLNAKATFPENEFVLHIKKCGGENLIRLSARQLSLNSRKMVTDSPTLRPTASPQLCPPTTKRREAKRRLPSPSSPEESRYFLCSLAARSFTATRLRTITDSHTCLPGG